MKLKVTHVTTYTYDVPVFYALQQLRLIPRTGHGQHVVNWATSITGGSKQAVFDDHLGNHTELVLVDDGATRIEIISEGQAETDDNLAGVIGRHTGYAPLWFFEAATPRTMPGSTIRQLARQFPKADANGVLDQLHALSRDIHETVAYETGKTDSDTTAEGALGAGHGVCQDHAHIMISTARLMGYPARYISGYLMMNETIEQDASHAWCEVFTEALGWVGFDVSNGISPDGRYVRVATGRDYSDAAPIHGIRQGQGGEDLHVALQVQQ